MYEQVSFTFCGYAFRPRKAYDKKRKQNFTRFLPAVAPEKLTDVSRKAVSWRLQRRTTLTLDDLAEEVNPVLRGWLTQAPHSILAVDDPRLVGMQFQPDLDQPTTDRLPHLPGLAFGHAMDHHIVREPRTGHPDIPGSSRRRSRGAGRCWRSTGRPDPLAESPSPGRPWSHRASASGPSTSAPHTAGPISGPCGARWPLASDPTARSRRRLSRPGSGRDSEGTASPRVWGQPRNYLPVPPRRRADSGAVTRFHPLVLVAVAIFAVLFAVALVVIWFSGRRAKPPSRPRR